MTWKKRNTKNKRNCFLLFEGLEGLEYVVFDVETTGLDSKIDFIVELSAIKYKISNRKAVEIQRKSIFIKPPFYIDKKVVEIHGITNEFLQDKPSEDMVIEEIIEFLGEKPIIVGYNVQFDIDMVSQMYRRCDKEFNYEICLDVLEMARDIILPGETENYKLQTVAEHYGLDDEIHFHHAIDDVVATQRVLEVLYEEYKNQEVSVIQNSVYVNYAYYWKGRNKQQQGLYVNTNLGKIWYSTFQKYWCSTEVDLSKLNIDDLENQLFTKYHFGYTDLSKITEKKWQEIKK